MQYTPGPWKWDGDDLWHVGNGYSDVSNPHLYTGIRVDNTLQTDTLKHNKVLVAAAPEMLELLRKTLELIEHSWRPEGFEELAGDIRRLLAKVGEQP